MLTPEENKPAKVNSTEDLLAPPTGNAKVLRLGHSPDSDDAFMWYALAASKIPTPGFRFTQVMEDIQALNERARSGELEVTAISAHAYAYVHQNYAILTHGASFGSREYGPTLVTREPKLPEELKGKRIAIPGFMTSAYLALRLFLPEFEAVFVPFKEIMAQVKEGKVDAGLLIHEGQLTHPGEGLHLVANMGQWWYEETGLPLPLGLNTINNKLDLPTQREVSRLLKESIVYSLSHRQESLGYALGFAADIDTAIADKYVGWYVNDLTVDMGEEGRKSVTLFLQRGAAAGIIPDTGAPVFVD